MKPTFALDFRNDAIGLLHRTSRGWQAVGDTSIDAPDLTEALGYLRATAVGLAPQGLTTKVVIPNTQILYTTVIAPGPDAGRRRRQIAKALEGRTPYAVEDLVFDWSGSGPEVQVAVIARETLAEAEAFAAEHRFNPLCFVAAPEPGKFKGEPWFGLTELAPSLLPEGARLDRDQDPVSVVGREPVLPDAVPLPEVVPENLPEVVPEVSPEPVLREAILPVVASGPEVLPAPLNAATPEPVQPEAALPAEMPDEAEPVALDVLTVEPMAAGLAEAFAALPDPEPNLLPEPVAEIKPSSEPAPADISPQPAPVFAPPEVRVSQTASRWLDQPQALVVNDEAPMAVDVADPDEPPTAAAAAPALPDDIPPPPSSFAMSAFASRRAADPVVGSKSAKTSGTPPSLGPTATPPPTAGPGPTVPPVVVSPFGPMSPAALPSASRPAFIRPPQVVASDAARPLPVTSAKPASKDAVSAKALRGPAASVTAPGIAGSKPKRPVVQAQARPLAPGATAANAQPQSTTRAFGDGLGSRAVPVRGKPRHLGLILTGLLLLFLALVAGWSTFFLASFRSTDTPTEAVVEAEPAADPDALAATAAIPGPDDEMLADMQDPAAFADAALPVPEETTEEIVVEAPLAPEPAPTTGLVTEAAPAAAPVPTPQDEIFLATMDAAPQPPDALALPQPDAASDPLPAAAVPPPPFGTVYQFEANGLIKPTPEGILTPEGVLLVAGQPPLIPPPRPAALAVPEAAALPSPEVAALPLADAAALPLAAAPAVPVDPALASVRPRSRPAGLVPAAAASDDDASLAPGNEGRFASLRPRARPPELLAAKAAVQSASLAVIEPNASTSPLALVVARKPAPRPTDMSRAVEAAVAAAVADAVRQPDPVEPEREVAAKPKVQAEADDEPEIATAMPRLPTKASVAKQATFVNAINLSKTNLIGVYGTQSSRYALVRLSSGRYKKVKVGDSIDGGKIAAITSTEVRYQKGGKIVTLALPKG